MGMSSMGMSSMGISMPPSPMLSMGMSAFSDAVISWVVGAPLWHSCSSGKAM